MRISPKAMRTEESMMPTGGSEKAAVSNAHPKMHIAVATISWRTDFFICHCSLEISRADAVRRTPDRRCTNNRTASSFCRTDCCAARGSSSGLA